MNEKVWTPDFSASVAGRYSLALERPPADEVACDESSKDLTRSFVLVTIIGKTNEHVNEHDKHISSGAIRYTFGTRICKSITNDQCFV